MEIGYPTDVKYVTHIFDLRGQPPQIMLMVGTMVTNGLVWIIINIEFVSNFHHTIL